MRGEASPARPSLRRGVGAEVDAFHRRPGPSSEPTSWVPFSRGRRDALDRRRARGARYPDGAGDQAFSRFRMDGRVSLSSRAQRPALDLGHRRLLVPRHRARRRGADRRHVGDERLSPRSHGQDDRPQRPHVPARGRDAADRLRCGRPSASARFRASPWRCRWSRGRRSRVPLMARRARWCAAFAGAIWRGCPASAGTSSRARSTASTPVRASRSAPSSPNI